MFSILLFAFLAIWFIPPMLTGSGILCGYLYEKRIPVDLRPWLGFLFALTCIPFYGAYLVGNLIYTHFKYGN